MPRRDLEALLAWIEAWLAGDPPVNVWLGATIVNQEEADRDIPKLLAVPARVRFLSCEPLLGRIDLCGHLGMWWNQTMGCFEAFGSQINAGRFLDGKGLHWVIAGGESGPKARPMHPDWARALRDQCVAAGVAFHHKQWGEWVTEDQSPPDITLPGESRCPWAIGTNHDGWPKGDQTAVYKVGKKAAGRLLDGRTWDEFPS